MKQPRHLRHQGAGIHRARHPEGKNQRRVRVPRRGLRRQVWSWPHTLLAALAAKVVNRPVRLQLTRAQMYSMAGHQPATVQTIALGANQDGKLTGIRHDSINPTSVFDHYIEYAAMASRHLWGASWRDLNEPQSRSREPQHAGRVARTHGSARAFRSGERHGRAGVRHRR